MCLVETGGVVEQTRPAAMQLVGGDRGHTATAKARSEREDLVFDPAQHPREREEREDDRGTRGEQGPTHDDDATETTMKER